MKAWELRAALAAALGLVLVTTLSACATRPNFNEIILYYKSGVGDDHKFVECIPPGSDGKYAVDDDTFSLPTTLRTWSIRADGTGDSTTPIDTGTKFGPDGQPGPHVLVFSTATFYLNTNCGTGKLAEKDPASPLPQFWQNLGSRPWGKDAQEISDNSGSFNLAAWKAMLEDTLVAAEEKVLADGSRFFSADELDSNAHGERSTLERRLAPFFQTELRAKLGGDYFCGVGYKRNQQTTWTEYVVTGTDKDGAPVIDQQQKNGYCPPVQISITDVNFSDPKIAAARAAVYAAEQEAKAKLIAAQAELDQSKLLGQAANDPAYLRYKEIQAQVAAAEACKANPNCTVIIDGTGNANINATTGHK